MDDYPSNSHRDKPSSKKPDPEDKKIERIVEGVVVRRKASLFKRFLKLFGFGDIKGVGEFVLYTILIPAAKDTTSEAFGTGLDRIIHGESRPHNRRSSSRYGRDDNYYNYGNRYNTNSSNGSSRRDRDRDRDRDEPERNISRRARATHEFDEIIIPSRHEANEVIDQLCEIISKFDDVSVADLYAMVNVPSSFSDRQWGWTNLRDATVSKVRGGYLLDLPKPEPID